MTKDQAREMGQLMVDWADGKCEVEFFDANNRWRVIECPDWRWGLSRYRRKPEKKYRPFTPAELLAHMNRIVKRTETGVSWEIVGMHAARCRDCEMFAGVVLELEGSQTEYSADYLLQNFTMDDGTPCGVEE